jgi:hypothetical protein
MPLNSIVRRNLLGVVALVQGWLEDLNVLLSDPSAADAADHLFRLATEHAAADDLNPPATVSIAHHTSPSNQKGAKPVLCPLT